MGKAKIAVQMMMFIKQAKEEGLYNVLKKLNEMGYNCVEMSQIPINDENMQALKQAKEEWGLEVCALSAAVELPADSPFDSLKDDFDKLVSDAKALGCKYLRVGGLPGKYTVSKQAYLEYASLLNEYGKRLKKEGIKLYHHNHEMEFEKFDGKTGLEIIVENTDPEVVGVELDVHWVQRGGQNPVDWIKKCEGRADIVHLKDFRINTGGTGEFDRANIVQFAEIGEGNLDFKAIIETCNATGVKYMPIEQDYTYDRTSYEALATSMKNIKEMGFGSQF